MAGQVIERAAAGDDVDEAEQRRAQLGSPEASSIARASSALQRMARRADGNAAASSPPIARLELDGGLRAATELTRSRSRRRRGHAPRAGRRPLHRLPAAVALALARLGGAATTEPEQALGEEEIDDDGEVDEEADDLQRDSRSLASS